MQEFQEREDKYMRRDLENEDFISGGVIKEAAKKIHEAGGCNAQDDYSRGWDAAIAEALNILLTATGYTIEEVLGHEEG